MKKSILPAIIIVALLFSACTAQNDDPVSECTALPSSFIEYSGAFSEESRTYSASGVNTSSTVLSDTLLLTVSQPETPSDGDALPEKNVPALPSQQDGSTDGGELQSTSDTSADDTLPPSSEYKATLEISTPYGVLLKGEYAIKEGDTAFSVLKAAVKIAGLSLDYSSFGSVYVKEIGGYRERAKGHSGSGWLYYVNGEKGRVSASKAVLKDGDTVYWKYSYNALSE